MTILCPACGKQNETDAPDACARCGCDLSALAGILASAANELSQAQRELQRGDWAEALAHAECSWRLLHNSSTVQVGCLITAAMGDMDRLGQWRRRAKALAAE